MHFLQVKSVLTPYYLLILFCNSLDAMVISSIGDQDIAQHNLKYSIQPDIV